jgi:tRNA(Ile)-lysidine synthase
MSSQLPAIRSAVRTFLEKLEAGDRIVVAVSGGADSLALAYALSQEVKKLALQLSAVTIDHQLQNNSAQQANIVVEQMKELGVECAVVKVNVEITEGLEASARKARYGALDNLQADAIFLGHTHNDQAENVLLGLARGSGTRSLSGMADVNGRYVRPFLTITREQTESVCNEIGLTPWNDPHNKDSQFARVRVRTQALPVLEETIGPGISDALVRSAQLLRDDADALDQWAEEDIVGLDLHDLDCTYLQGLPRAIRSRIIRRAVYAQGAPSGSLSAEHVGAVEALICAWNGQGPAHLPGGVKVERFSGRLSLSRHQP